MKAYDEDWGAILRALPAWQRLAPRARRLALEHLKPSGMHPAAPLAAVLPELRAAGFAEASPTGVRVGLTEPMRPLMKLLRELNRAPLWPAPGEPALRVYLAEHFTGDELIALGRPAGNGGWGWENRYLSAPLASAEQWVEGFLAADTQPQAEAWEDARRSVGAGAPLFYVAEVAGGARRLVRALLGRPHGAALSELPALLPALPAPVAAGALRAALRYLLVFAALDDELLPRIGLWPAVVERLNRPAAAPPRPVAVEEEFHAAVLMEDMTSVLVAAAAEPLRLRANDGAIFARARQAVAGRMLQAPEWTGPLLGDPEQRAETASWLLRVQKLAGIVGLEPRARGRTAGEPSLAPTPQGTNWLALPDRERLATVLTPLREATPRRRGGWDEPEWSYSPVRFGYGDGDELREPLTRAFGSLPAEGFVPLVDFLDYQARTANPLLEAGRRPGLLYMHGIGCPPQREQAERAWKEVLLSFLSERLLALGGARLGRSAQGALCIALAGPGRYLLGMAESFDYGFTGEAAVIVQPNFEIVFLALAPKLEAQIGRFAERVGAGPGVMFRLTRASVMAAAEAGLEAEALLGTLGEASTHPLPENVARQLRDWFAQVRRVRLRASLLVECPDAETAARVLAAAGRNVRALTPTLLEVSDASKKSRSALLRQLRAGGVFVEE